ncbi:MAG: hypothetical protein JNM56_02740 [Planctomycetia bacterium]|nr:hypothetical protein [Planctomycetia bacterium]
MNCFRHQDRSALGVCGACGKGLCQDCFADGKILACKGYCEDDARDVVMLREAQVRLVATSLAWLRFNRFLLYALAVFLLGMGAFTGCLSLLDFQRAWSLFVLGGVLAAFGLVLLLRTRQIPSSGVRQPEEAR